MARTSFFAFTLVRSPTAAPWKCSTELVIDTDGLSKANWNLRGRPGDRGSLRRGLGREVLDLSSCTRANALLKERDVLRAEMTHLSLLAGEYDDESHRFWTRGSKTRWVPGVDSDERVGSGSPVASPVALPNAKDRLCRR